MTGHGLILAAPSSGSGKTTVTLGILRALARRGIAVRGAKSGPDYIDPAFHTAACGRPCVNLDAWAMNETRIKSLAAGHDLLIVEGAMGLFDGAPPNGKGAVADLARMLALPVVLVVDATSMSQSIAPLVAGFAGHDPDVRVAGVILNKVGSDRHLALLTAALAPLGIPVMGAVMRDADLSLPSRHLGLVQAGEHADLEAYLTHAADRIAASVDLDALQALATPYPSPAATTMPRPESNKHFAVARDPAFAFLYPHQIASWQAAGVEISYFSPLEDDPVPEADFVYLPGGYPELHADLIASNQIFMKSLRKAAQDTVIYGECGGYMVLGETLIDAQGDEHSMAGLLALQTSFAARRLHLGYRTLRSRSPHMKGQFKGHEFHYASTLKAEGAPLFDAQDAQGNALPPMGLWDGTVLGSYAHVIDAT